MTEHLENAMPPREFRSALQTLAERRATLMTRYEASGATHRAQLARQLAASYAEEITLWGEAHRLAGGDVDLSWVLGSAQAMTRCWLLELANTWRISARRWQAEADAIAERSAVVFLDAIAPGQPRPRPQLACDADGDE